ncbi:MAG: ABC transporter substrate-binding protein [Symploca sp. SIO1C2]|nr:ABC transporter substrate-binding protein [Symploca sp. SIO1C2]
MAHVTSRRNPYIIGRPITEKGRFFGRESLFHFLEDSLIQGEQVILLHGQRRIGKSSVLFQIPHSVECDGFHFVPFDLQDQSLLPLSVVLENLATEIVDYLELEDSVTLPTAQELEADLTFFSRVFLTSVYQVLDNKNLVLLLDEFDVLSTDNRDNNQRSNFADKYFFPYLKSLIDEQEKLFIIPVVGRKLDDMQQLLTLFKRAPNHEIGLLDETSAKRLILNPAHGILAYDQNAIKAILELSAGHPYFTQVICFALFGQARNEGNWNVTQVDVEKVVDKAIESAEGGLAWFWDGLPIAEQVVFSAVAKAQERAKQRQAMLPENPLILLQEYGVIPTKEIKQAAKQLINKVFLDETGRKVKVELVRRWLVSHYPLRQEIWQLEKLDKDFDNFFRAAEKWENYGGNKLKKMRKACEQVLEFNPNHFGALFAIADISLTVEDFSKAVEFYTRAYKVDPISNQEGLVQSLLSYGNDLWRNQQQFKQAKQHFERVLKIDPNNAIARDKLSELAPLVDKDRRIFVGAIVVAAVVTIPLLIGIGYYLGVNSCPPDQQRIDGICKSILPPQPFYVPEWEPERFSRGERTIFTSKFNPNFERGIKEFKQGNYSEATNFFEQTVAESPNDPEVLIYYNNALAREQGSPLTLAVVVSAIKSTLSAQEILRGVAQAQNQFNISGGLNGRLLELVIANDGNEPDKSEKVAQELEKDPSVLGVIGHSSSDASKAALVEYEKANLAMISPTSTSPLLQGRVFFRAVSSDEAAGQILAQYTKNNLGLDKAVIFYNTNSFYSNSLREAFQKSFEQLGGRIVDKIDWSNTTLNMESEVPRSIFRDQAEAGLLFPNKALTSQAIEVARVNAELRSRPANPDGRGLKLLGGDTLYSNTTLNEERKAVEGLILAVPWFRGTSEAQEFSQAARRQWGGDVSWRTAASYDATQAFIQTLLGNPDRTKVLQRLREVNLSSSETSGEALQFTSDGERLSEPILVKVVDGEFKLVEEKQKEPDSP